MPKIERDSYSKALKFTPTPEENALIKTKEEISNIIKELEEKKSALDESSKNFEELLRRAEEVQEQSKSDKE